MNDAHAYLLICGRPRALDGGRLVAIPCTERSREGSATPRSLSHPGLLSSSREESIDPESDQRSSSRRDTKLTGLHRDLATTPQDLRLPLP